MSTATLTRLDTTTLDDSFDLDVQIEEIVATDPFTQSIGCSASACNSVGITSRITCC